jgi:hypothetical protein
MKNVFNKREEFYYRLVTCLEAGEMEYDFISTSSRCGYCPQNKSLNKKTLTIPFSQLSNRGSVHPATKLEASYQPLYQKC